MEEIIKNLLTSEEDPYNEAKALQLRAAEEKQRLIESRRKARVPNEEEAIHEQFVKLVPPQTKRISPASRPRPAEYDRGWKTVDADLWMNEYNGTVDDNELAEEPEQTDSIETEARPRRRRLFGKLG